MEDFKVRLEAGSVSYMMGLVKAAKSPAARNILFNIFYRLSFNHNISLRNLQHVFPDRNRKELKKINRSSLRRFFDNIHDFLNSEHINEHNLAEHVEVKNIDNLEDASKDNKGLVVVTAHLGNFLMGCTLAPYMLKRKVTAILDVDCAPKLRGKVVDKLSSKGSRIIDRKEWKKGYGCLANDEALLLVADQAMGNKAVVEIDIFGSKRKFPIGPALIGYNCQASIVPAFFIAGKDRYQLVFEKPLVVDRKKDLDFNIQRITQQWASLVEKYVKRYPDQYLWRLRL